MSDSFWTPNHGRKVDASRHGVAGEQTRLRAAPVGCLVGRTVSSQGCSCCDVYGRAVIEEVDAYDSPSFTQVNTFIMFILL